MQNDKISICPLWQWSSYIRYQHKLIRYGLLAIQYTYIKSWRSSKTLFWNKHRFYFCLFYRNSPKEPWLYFCNIYGVPNIPGPVSVSSIFWARLPDHEYSGQVSGSGYRTSCNLVNFRLDFMLRRCPLHFSFLCRSYIHLMVGSWASSFQSQDLASSTLV